MTDLVTVVIQAATIWRLEMECGPIDREIQQLVAKMEHLPLEESRRGEFLECWALDDWQAQSERNESALPPNCRYWQFEPCSPSPPTAEAGWLGPRRTRDSQMGYPRPSEPIAADGRSTSASCRGDEATDTT